MRRPYIVIFFLFFCLLYSCIEEYNAVMEDEDNEILVVEGHIVGGQECEFIIQQSSNNHVDFNQTGPRYVVGANVYVVCSNGEVFGAVQHADYHYYVNVGDLDPDETYHLVIQRGNDCVYQSEPMYPLPSPALKKVSYTMSEDSLTVQLRISNEDPHGETYYLWTYDEHWEIWTPLFTDWEYDPSNGQIVRVEQRTNHGWCHSANHPFVVGHNLDYGKGAINDLVIYTMPKQDNRFNTRYHTRVRQTAISRAEYEYYKQMEAQASKTNGIFTLMPAQLPSNIHNSKGFKAEGYIGVHQNSTEAEIYINRDAVNHLEERRPQLIPDSVAKKITWRQLYRTGFKVYLYDLTTKATEWTNTWCVDCRDPYWGASLERPDFWKSH